MQNAMDNPSAFLADKTGITWEDKGGTLSHPEILDAGTAKKVSDVLASIGITPSIHTTKAGHIVSIAREAIKSSGPQPSTRVVEAASADMKQKYSELAARNPKFVQSDFNSAVPNRFSNIPCVKATQLTHHDTWKSIDEDGIEHTREADIPYDVHANHVELKDAGLHVICSQAPKKESEVEFWRAAMTHTNMIIDLTNKGDREEKGVQKYFPPEVNSHFVKGNVTVTCMDETKALEGVKKLKSHTYLVEQEKQGEPKQEAMVTRVHFRGWPDFGAVSPKDLSTIVNYVRNHPDAVGDKPVWVHCRAGVGRSGTVIVGLALANMKDKLTTENYHETIDKLILDGRKDRGVLFVQDAVQYELLHEFAKGLIDGSIPTH